jgi:hypothetical protein
MKLNLLTQNYSQFSCCGNRISVVVCFVIFDLDLIELISRYYTSFGLIQFTLRSLVVVFFQ